MFNFILGVFNVCFVPLPIAVILTSSTSVYSIVFHYPHSCALFRYVGIRDQQYSFVSCWLLILYKILLSVCHIENTKQSEFLVAPSLRAERLIWSLCRVSVCISQRDPPPPHKSFDLKNSKTKMCFSSF